MIFEIKQWKSFQTNCNLMKRTQLCLKPDHLQNNVFIGANRSNCFITRRSLTPKVSTLAFNLWKKAEEETLKPKTAHMQFKYLRWHVLISAAPPPGAPVCEVTKSMAHINATRSQLHWFTMSTPLIQRVPGVGQTIRVDSLEPATMAAKAAAFGVLPGTSLAMTHLSITWKYPSMRARKLLGRRRCQNEPWMYFICQH